MTGYGNGNLLRMKGTIIPQMKEFEGAVENRITPIKLFHIHFGHLNVDSLIQLQQHGKMKGLAIFRE